MLYEVMVTKNTKTLAERCKKAVSFTDRLVGLIGKSDFPTGEGVWFPHCNDIHMWFMKMPIDVVFLREEKDSGTYRVTRVVPGLKPWGILPTMSLKATDVIELPVGTIQKCEVKIGDQVCISSK